MEEATRELEEAEADVARAEVLVAELEEQRDELAALLDGDTDERCVCGEWITVRRRGGVAVAFDGLTVAGIRDCPGCSRGLSEVFG